MKKSTPWITIAEETLHTPVSGEKATRVTQTAKSGSSVKHKFFWGVGFAVVVVMSFAMLVPQQFNALIQGNLFDAPGVEAPELTQAVKPLGVLPPGTPEAPTTPEPEEVVFTNETVVQPETMPVEVQIKPLSETKPAEAAPAAPVTETPAEETDANKRLLEELRKQVGDLKAEKETVTPPVVAPGLPGLPALPGMPPITGIPAIPGISQIPLNVFPTLRPAAPEAAGVTATLGQIPMAQGPYRLNPYRVTVRPEQVLQQNLGGGYVASYPPAVASPYAPQAYAPQADLTRVQGTPGSGPREMIALALALTFLGLLIWKAVRLSRA